MLTRLYLRDFAVVSEAEAGFGPGMTVVSGETGAGKSLLVDALGLLTGSRADSAMVRHGATRAELAAEFTLDDAPQALQWLLEQALDDGDACQLRRVLLADGGSRAWINGRPASAGQLADLGQRLLEIHGQHEHQALLGREHQLQLLDAFGGHEGLAATVAGLARDTAAVRRRLDELAARGDPAERLDYLRHQLGELDAESLDETDIEELLASHRRHSHAESLRQGCTAALARLTAEEPFGLARGLREVQHELGPLLEHDPRLGEVQALLDSAAIQLDDATASLERLYDDLDLDPAQLEALEARLARLHDLARKHRVPLAGLARRREELASETQSLERAGTEFEALAGQRDALARRWDEAAHSLSDARRAAAARLGTAVTARLAELGMGGGVFEVELEPVSSDSPTPGGRERCEFKVSANPGQPPRPLRKVASGGELSRISLAIEVAALGLDSVPSMVFDEVDSGIGGAVAEVVGRKLRALGETRQVLCVTHLPQVAAQGHAHLQVSKSIDSADSRSAVGVLDFNGRIEELARMLGGVEIGAETRELARQMLSRAGEAG